MSFTIVALPEEKTLKELNILKNYFYQNGFRYINKECKENAHITMLQLSSQIPSNFYKQLQDLIVLNHPFSLENFSLWLKEHKRVFNSPEWRKKYPEGCWWFTLLFPNNIQLIQLAKKIRALTLKLGIDSSLEYAQNIATATWEFDKNFNLFEYLCNHMNICNYIRLDKMIKAKKIFENQFSTKKIIFDKIALVDNQKNIIWAIHLTELI